MLVWFHFLNFYEVFSAFISANDTGSLANSLFGVNVFNPVPDFFLFRDFNFTPSCYKNHINNGDELDPGINNPSVDICFV